MVFNKKCPKGNEVKKMQKDKLLGLIKSQGKTVYSVIDKVNDYGVSMSPSTFYKGLRDERPFKANEIKALAKVLKLDEKQIYEIFFAEFVS